MMFQDMFNFNFYTMYTTIIYNTRLGKEASGRRCYFEAKNIKEATKKADALVIRLSGTTKDAIAYTKIEEK